MNCFRIRLAGKIIQIRCVSSECYSMCKDYIVEDGKPDFCVDTVDIVFPFLDSWAKKQGYVTKQSVDSSVAVSYSLDSFESALIYAMIAKQMVSMGICLLHGASIALDGKCFTFIAPSGTGKTTHIKNWIKKFPRTIVINGDKPLIDAETLLVYGTPWCGKEGMNTNTSAPLAGIITLERGKNSISPISFHEMLPVLIRQTYIPQERDLAIKVYQNIGSFKRIPFYRLQCTADEESAIIAYNGILG